MKRGLFRIVSIVWAACVVSFFGSPSRAGDAPTYVPQKGDKVVIYIHHFKPENFAAAVKLMESEYTAAHTATGQTRHNDFLVNPQSYEVVVVSYFPPGSSVEDWHQSPARLDVRKKLEPMWSEPQKFQKYDLDVVTDISGTVK